MDNILYICNGLFINKFVRITRTKRQVTAWVLILCMLPLMMVKLTHHHQAEEEHSCPAHSQTDDTGHKHNHDHCVICKFTLSPFLDFEFNDNTLFLAEISFEPVFYQSGHILETTHYSFLRAPPFFNV